MKTIRTILAWLLACTMLLGTLSAVAEEKHIWQLGDQGEAVRWIQERLFVLAYSEEQPTGQYDEATEAAVRRFQREHQLLETGMVEETTWRMLAEETQPATTPVPNGWETEVCVEEEALYDGWMPAMSGTAFSAAAKETEIAWNTEEFTQFHTNGFQSTAISPLSTFAADVDTSSYAQIRRRILDGEPVPADCVRVEEMLNYFHYDYAGPKGNEPFGVTVTEGPCPWNEKTLLLQIGLQARTVEEAERPDHHLVFLIDTSGSMEGQDRLDLVKRAFLLLLEELQPTDRISIVAYASQDRIVLENVPASEKTRIMEAISELEAYGATNGTAGLNRAYEVAERHQIPGGVNRILMATDGDLNVGPSGEGDLARLVMEKKKGGISLTCLGVGMGNYKDNRMEALADYGDGNCRYIDSIHEARKALVSEAGGTFITVARDVKLQVDFNPRFIRGYRLIGYEDRMMAAEDFANDERDGGEIGSGHRVTVLYEIVPVGTDFDFGETASRYQAQPEQEEAQGEMLTVSIRAKEPEGGESKLYEIPVSTEVMRETLDDNLKFAAAVAEVGMLLRGSDWQGTASYAQALELLRNCGSVTGDVYKEEFLYLVGLLARE